MSAEPVWCDPPTKWTLHGYSALEPLTERPGDWARIATRQTNRQAYDVAKYLRRRANKPPGEWEFTARKMSQGGWGVWARYLGET